MGAEYRVRGEKKRHRTQRVAGGAKKVVHMLEIVKIKVWAGGVESQRVDG